MWDDKRKTIWLATALVAVTLVVVPQAYDEDGRFDVGYFILLEIIFLAVVIIMFTIYAKSGSK
jgi:hypothetical protein